MNKRSMEEKIDARLMAVGLFSLVLTASVFLLAFKVVLQQQIWQDLNSECGQVAQAYEYLHADADLENFTGDNLRITLIDNEGNVLFESADVTNMENHLSRPEIRSAMENGSGQAMRDSTTLGYSTYYCARLLPNGNVLRVARDASSASAIYNQAVPLVLLSCFLILLVSVVLSALLTRQLVKPILKMGENIDQSTVSAPYKELEPFVETLTADRLLRENNARIRQEFTANVSHELKTPLTSISGYAEMIENGMAKPEDVKGFASRIRREAQRMIRLVGDIIRLSELDTISAVEEETAPVFRQVDLAEIARACADSLSANAKNAFVTLQAEGPATPAKGDADMLEELCYNLCDNAIRYNRPGGRVTVTVGKNGQTPFLRVSDTGIGIPQESQERVFERFYRVDKSRSKATGGTGLGLAIVKHVAQVHGAKLRLESQEGKGTAITVEFAE